MKQHLAVSAIGSDRTGMVHDLTRVISDCGGSISESRMASLGNEFAMLVLVSGNWHSLAKLESELTRLGEATGLSLHLKRTEPRAPRTELLPYSIDVVCLDQSGIVTGLSGFCASRGIDIAEVSTRTYPAAHTGAQMFAVQMIINVPKRLQLAQLLIGDGGGFAGGSGNDDSRRAIGDMKFDETRPGVEVDTAVRLHRGHERHQAAGVHEDPR